MFIGLFISEIMHELHCLVCTFVSSFACVSFFVVIDTLAAVVFAASKSLRLVLSWDMQFYHGHYGSEIEMLGHGPITAKQENVLFVWLYFAFTLLIAFVMYFMLSQ